MGKKTYFRVKQGRWQEVSKREWDKALRRKGANPEHFSSVTRMPRPKIPRRK